MEVVTGVIDEVDVETCDLEGLVVDIDVEKVEFGTEVDGDKVSVGVHPINATRIRLIDRKQQNFIHLLVIFIYSRPIIIRYSWYL